MTIDEHGVGPPEDPAAHGIDGPDARPGVPMESRPERADGAHWDRPERQADGDAHLVRAGLDRPTHVFGTAQRPRGLSGALRRGAYRIPEHYARHWMLLLLADRIDVAEARLSDALAGPLESAGMERGARAVRANPLGVVAGALLGAWVAARVVR